MIAIKSWKQMGSPEKRIKMNHRNISCTPCDIRSHFPQPSVGVRAVANPTQPLYERTWIINSFKRKREKQLYSHNLETLHTQQTLVFDHQCSIVSGHLSKPRWGSTDPLMAHTMDSRFVAWSIECCDGGSKNRDFAGDSEIIGTEGLG